jgi:hypothetical protein
MANLRRSIYIGIGGAGVKAIAYTKKMFEEAFGVGNIPQQIQFLAIDSDREVSLDKSLPTDIEENLLLIGNAGVAADLRSWYDLRKSQGMFDWMLPVNEQYIPRHAGFGAGQKRTNGRFLLELEAERVMQKVAMAYNSVMSLGFNDLGPTEVDIHIVCSLSGGTGSGAFIPLACMIKERFGYNVNLFGYGIMWGVFVRMDVTRSCTPYVVGNAYAASLELDYVQSATMHQPVKFSLSGRNFNLHEPLFCRYHALDNVTDDGCCINSLDVLCEMLATHLYAHGAEAGDAIEADFSAIDWRCGHFDVGNKHGWLHRVGACVMTTEDLDQKRAKVNEMLSPFLKLNSHGLLHRASCMSLVDAMVSRYTAIMYAPDDVDARDKVFDCLPNGDCLVVPTVSEHLKQKMIICRVDAAIIPYCVDCLDQACVREYEEFIAGARYNPHIDLQIYEDMKRKDFKLKPEIPD